MARAVLSTCSSMLPFPPSSLTPTPPTTAIYWYINFDFMWKLQPQQHRTNQMTQPENAPDDKLLMHILEPIYHSIEATPEANSTYYVNEEEWLQFLDYIGICCSRKTAPCEPSQTGMWFQFAEEWLKRATLSMNSGGSPEVYSYSGTKQHDIRIILAEEDVQWYIDHKVAYLEKYRMFDAPQPVLQSRCLTTSEREEAKTLIQTLGSNSQLKPSILAGRSLRTRMESNDRNRERAAKKRR